MESFADLNTFLNLDNHLSCIVGETRVCPWKLTSRFSASQRDENHIFSQSHPEQWVFNLNNSYHCVNIYFDLLMPNNKLNHVSFISYFYMFKKTIEEISVQL